MCFAYLIAIRAAALEFIVKPDHTNLLVFHCVVAVPTAKTKHSSCSGRSLSKFSALLVEEREAKKAAKKLLTSVPWRAPHGAVKARVGGGGCTASETRGLCGAV